MADLFDDSRLDDPETLTLADAPLRRVAESGARVRLEAGGVTDALDAQDRDVTPRAVVAAGSDARLLRAVLEPFCPVPFVAWPGPGLPGWVGALDLVVVLAPGGGDAETGSAVREAVRRGSTLIVACPAHSVLAEHAQGRHTTQLPTQTDDSLAVAVITLQALHRLGVGPEVNADEVARVLDDVAVRCSPHRELGNNPAKDLAIGLADILPLVWGGSVLAARAARRVAETIRRTTGRPALAADAGHLMPVLEAAGRRDVFADPFADVAGGPTRPGLLILDDGAEEAAVRERRGWLSSAAVQHDVRSQTITATEGSEMARYAALLATGTYAALYLGIGSATDSKRGAQ